MQPSGDGDTIQFNNKYRFPHNHDRNQERGLAEESEKKLYWCILIIHRVNETSSNKSEAKKKRIKYYRRLHCC